MHEFSLASEIVDVALKAADDAGAGVVTTVHITIDPASHIDPFVLAGAFEIAAAGTRASLARLDVVTAGGERGGVAVTAVDVAP